MKKTVFVLVAIVAALVSCDKTESEKNKSGEVIPVLKNDSTFFSGTLLANASSGDCETRDTKVSINYTDNSDSVSITIFKAKLAQRMPAMDIVIPGINLNNKNNVIVLSSEKSVPLAMGNEFPAYTVTGFDGEINGDSLIFSLMFGSTPTCFGGKILK
ncbi:MAG: hypothetical protein IKS24_03260 [Bacteroidaceae bacterium]|nr:hypothetical protein [Bacteroidaceae bacterium]